MGNMTSQTQWLATAITASSAQESHLIPKMLYHETLWNREMIDACHSETFIKDWSYQICSLLFVHHPVLSAQEPDHLTYIMFDPMALLLV